MIYQLIRAVVVSALRIFYRLEVGGPRPPEGVPIIFCGNHPNGLLDPMLVLAASPRPIRFLAKEPLFRLPVIGALLRAMGAVPVYRTQDGASTGGNAGTFDAAVSTLGAGGAICIFPEGTSHSVPRLLPLKTGAARIALLAQATRRADASPVLVVPVGVTYAAKHRFRSRALAVFGAPIDVGAFRTAASDDEARMRGLTAAIRTGLQEVCVELDRVDDLPLLARIDRLWAEERGLPREAGPLQDAFPRWKSLLAGVAYHRTHAPQRMLRLRRTIEAHLSRLDRLGLTEDVLAGPPGAGAVLRFLVRRLLPIVVLAPLAVAGAAAFWLPWRAPGWLSRVLSVSLDVEATYKLLAGFVFAVAAWAGLSALAFGFGGPPVGSLAVVALPPLGLLAMVWAEQAEEALEDARIFLRLRGREGLRTRLRARRRAIVAELEALASEVEASSASTGAEAAADTAAGDVPSSGAKADDTKAATAPRAS